MITAEGYLELFEKGIIIAGVEKGVLPVKNGMVPSRDGKLDKTPFGKFLSNKFDYPDDSLVIEYYGLLKKSSGFCICCGELEKKGIEVKRIRTKIVHFSSIKIEHVTDLDKSLATEFPGFKKYLLSLRGF